MMYKPILYILYSSALYSGARLVFCLTFLLSLGVSAGWAQIRVLGEHNDLSRTGANLNETSLTTANVNVSTFGKLFAMPVDGFVYAQPLYMTIGTQNVLFVATAHDSVYAFNADTGAQLWRKSLGTPVPSSVINTPNIQVEVGIISTPVIDPTTNTLYVVAKTYEPASNPVQNFQLHALDISTGTDKLTPVQISAQYPGSGDPNDGKGHVLFDAARENQRAALTEVNHSVIYVAFASHEDYTPFHGWLLAYSAANLQQLAVFNTTPNGFYGGGGIWMSGQGLVADSNNFVYLITGNSHQSDENRPSDHGESFLKLALSGSALSVPLQGGAFKAPNFDALNAADVDLGSGGAVAITGTPYIVGGGKQGLLYLVNTNGMGLVQQFQADFGLWGSPVLWTKNPAGPTLYVWGVNDSLKAFTFNGTTFNTPFAAESSVKTPSGFDPCGALSVTSNQSVAGTGILWATIPLADPDHQTVRGKLYAFDATNVAKELWDSGQNAARDDFGNFAKFVPPTVINGKVYVATDSKQVCAYGLNPAAANFTIGAHVKTVSSSTFVNVRNASGTIIGSQPTGTSGIIAAGPVVVPNTNYSGPSWNVTFATGPSGWVRQLYLVLSTP
jgi:outer membrane protein assembly factor BamB